MAFFVLLLALNMFTLEDFLWGVFWDFVTFTQSGNNLPLEKVHVMLKMANYVSFSAGTCLRFKTERSAATPFHAKRKTI